MNVARAYHSSCRVCDNLFVIGGPTADTTGKNTIEWLDLSAVNQAVQASAGSAIAQCLWQRFVLPSSDILLSKLFIGSISNTKLLVLADKDPSLEVMTIDIQSKAIAKYGRFAAGEKKFRIVHSSNHGPKLACFEH